MAKEKGLFMSESKSYYHDLYIIAKELNKFRENGDPLNGVQTIHNGLLNFYKQLLGELHYKEQKNLLTYMTISEMKSLENRLDKSLAQMLEKLNIILIK